MAEFKRNICFRLWKSTQMLYGFWTQSLNVRVWNSDSDALRISDLVFGILELGSGLS
ncbi:cytochrome p450 [Sesbania bispinosa]|nr:cytochrome p450 [Sesbania bispinosa]